MRTSALALVCCGLAWCLAGVSAPAAPPQYPLSIRFVDSATGYAIQPQSVTAQPHQPAAAAHRLDAGQVGRNGRAELALESGRHTLAVVAPGYHPMSGDFEMSEQNVYSICFVLDPLQAPPELQPDYIASLRRPDATLVQGFVADEDSGQPLSGVRVLASPSGGGTHTDERGFFRFYVPAGEGASAAPASLLFEQPGYQAEEKFYVEHAPGDVATYRIRLSRGGGKHTVDERQWRRLSAEPGALSAAATPVAPVTALAEPVPPLDVPVPQVTAATNSTVRVPSNIRVLESDGVTIDYVSMDTYARHVLPAEWINSWGATTGGTNSLNAGAVAVRCYAIAKINNASGSSTYDICGTSSCQNYGSATYTYSDNAVNYTANWVLISGSSIASTEYSAENNSLANSCGDGFTEPSTTGPVCIYDPVCTSKTRSGHGRGMCQWGSYRWSISTGGYPRRDWQWILRHYYPTLSLVKGAPLLVGDDVKALSSTLNVRACTDGSISSGVGCPVVATKTQGATGTIIGGPTQVPGDGYGFTWYQIQWSDGVVGWSVENYLERVFSAPTSPSNLAAAAAGTNRINLSWTDTSGGVAASFSLERAMASSGPWVQLTNVMASVTTYADLNLYPGSTWYYRVRAYNAGGYSGYSSVVSTTTSNPPPVLAPIASRDIVETTTLSFTNSAAAADSVQLITDFEPFASETANGVVMFRNPRYSSTTSAFLGSPGTTNLITAIPDFAAVTDTYTTTGHGAGRVLRVSCQVTNPTNPWLLLTTAGATTFPNPVIDFTRKLRFDIYCDHAIMVAVGCRETSTAAGTAIGSNGGTTGAIEWAGVTNVSGTAPMPTRTVAAGTWTTLTFDFPHEPIRSYSGGNGVLSTASGLGVLEHLALVPAGGTGIYNIYLDNFAVVGSRTLTYSLGAGAPANATLDPVTGVFTWTPTEAQGPGTYNNLSVVVADNSTPVLKTTNYFNVTVRESNSPPVLAAIANRTNYAGSIIAFTNSATDPDLPANLLSYSLCCGAPAQASLDPVSGNFLWPTTDADAGTTNALCVCATDNGTPPLTASQGFFVVVLPRPAIQNVSISGSTATLTWTAIPNTTFQVQYKDRLADTDWLPLGTPITPSGSVATAVDPDYGTVPQRFYRLLVP